MPDAPQPLLLDTGALYARLDPADVNHDRAQATFENIRTGELGFRPLYTSRYVLSELATLAQRQLSHAEAVRSLDAIRSSDQIRILTLGDDHFDAVCEAFGRYDDQGISFVDHTTAVLADRYEIEHVFAFDSDFSTLGLTRVPVDL
jgi:predicted nucleic acid-binding protein